MRNYWLSIRKQGIFRPGQEIKGLRGSVHGYVAQASPQIDAAKAEKNRFRMKTKYYQNAKHVQPTPSPPRSLCRVSSIRGSRDE